MTIRLKPEVVVITLTNLHHEVGHDQIHLKAINTPYNETLEPVHIRPQAHDVG